MKSFKEYLTERKRVYEFKVKIAGDCPKDCSAQIKTALSQFHVESCSSGKRTPIQETHKEFPDHKNVNVTLFDVCTSYPATSHQVRDKIAECLKIVHSAIVVRNIHEAAEEEINHQHNAKSGKSVLQADYEASNNQKIVGTQHTMSLLKELGKTKKSGHQHTGTNDALLAKSAPSEKSTDKPAKHNNISPVGSRKVKLPTAGGR
jgi:hypothetical protein